MSTFARLADLPLSVEEYGLSCLSTDTGGGWSRLSTVITLRGGGREGCGEDVNYSVDDQQAFLRAGSGHDLAGNWTLRSFSERLEKIELFPGPPEFPGQDVYRRWAFESAALDLALRQCGESIFARLAIEPRPIRFVASSGLEDEDGMERLRALLRAQPGLGLKLDAVPSWTAAMIAELAASERVAVIDFKGCYEGTPVDTEPDLGLYRRVLDAFPQALIEDPHRTEPVLELLEPHRDRVTWDAPIHSIADIEALRWEPRVLNVKPSRFGTLQALLDTYDHCRERGVELYGGGQFELGPGRGQIQLLASLFHPDGPNDVAPSSYNVPGDPEHLQGSPLAAPPADPGFRWEQTAAAR